MGEVMAAAVAMQVGQVVRVATPAGNLAHRRRGRERSCESLFASTGTRRSRERGQRVDVRVDEEVDGQCSGEGHGRATTIV